LSLFKNHIQSGSVTYQPSLLLTLTKMKRSKHFTPPHLKNIDSSLHCGMDLLSPNFFKVGNELLTLATSEVTKKMKGSSFDSCRYCFPAIIMFCTAFESYLNETIEFSRTLAIKQDTNNKESILKRIDDIKKAKEIKDKIKLFYKGYDSEDVGIDTNGSTYQNLIALFRLRNEIIHYSPDMTAGNKWPIRTKEAFFKSNPKIKENTTWTTTFGAVSVAKWAHDTTIAAIRLFAKISGSQDPFGEETPYPWHW